jgi:hypothetical protein
MIYAEFFESILVFFSILLLKAGAGAPRSQKFASTLSTHTHRRALMWQLKTQSKSVMSLVMSGKLNIYNRTSNVLFGILNELKSRGLPVALVSGLLSPQQWSIAVWLLSLAFA